MGLDAVGRIIYNGNIQVLRKVFLGKQTSRYLESVEQSSDNDPNGFIRVRLPLAKNGRIVAPDRTSYQRVRLIADLYPDLQDINAQSVRFEQSPIMKIPLTIKIALRDFNSEIVKQRITKLKQADKLQE